jgi:hypothetical protein
MVAGNITIEDLREFRRGLLEEIRTMLSERQAAPVQRWLKAYQLKKVLPLSRAKLQRLRASGKLPCAKFGRALIYDYYDIEKVVNEHKLVQQVEALKNQNRNV